LSVQLERVLGIASIALEEEHVVVARGRGTAFPNDERAFEGRLLRARRAAGVARRSLDQEHRSLEGFRKTRPADAPDSLVTPQILPSTSLSVDGERVQIVADLQGDVLQPSNSFVWIPSLRAVLAGDIVFNHVHPWLVTSNVESRQRWHQTIARIRALQPAVIVAAHKNRLDAPDTPDVLDAMDNYLNDFDRAVTASSTAEAVVATMMAKYTDYTVPLFLRYSAAAAVPKRNPGLARPLTAKRARSAPAFEARRDVVEPVQGDVEIRIRRRPHEQKALVVRRDVIHRVRAVRREADRAE
jgi:hypothetical protein